MTQLTQAENQTDIDVLRDELESLRTEISMIDSMIHDINMDDDNADTELDALNDTLEQLLEREAELISAIQQQPAITLDMDNIGNLFSLLAIKGIDVNDEVRISDGANHIVVSAGYWDMCRESDESASVYNIAYYSTNPLLPSYDMFIESVQLAPKVATILNQMVIEKL